VDTGGVVAPPPGVDARLIAEFALTRPALELEILWRPPLPLPAPSVVS
jgi:hypothetical protein